MHRMSKEGNTRFRACKGRNRLLRLHRGNLSAHEQNQWENLFSQKKKGRGPLLSGEKVWGVIKEPRARSLPKTLGTSRGIREKTGQKGPASERRRTPKRDSKLSPSKPFNKTEEGGESKKKIKKAKSDHDRAIRLSRPGGKRERAATSSSSEREELHSCR